MVLHKSKSSERCIFGVHSGTMHLFLFSVKQVYDSNSCLGSFAIPVYYNSEQ
jgi:hypothetical protein